MAFQNTGFQGDGFQVGNVSPSTPTLSSATETSGPVFSLDQTYVRAAILGSAFCLIATVAPSLGQADYAGGPNFKQPPRQDWCVKSPLTLVGVVQAPFRQLDWPNPRGASRSEQLGWIQTGKLPFTTFGFNKFDWPNPRGYQPLNLGFSDSFKLSLTTVKGTNQYDWPNPGLPRRNSDLTQTSSGLALSSVVVYPATITFDWPVPKGPVGSIGLRTWSDSFKLPLTTVKAPYLQTDWPVPKAAKGILQDFCPPSPLNLLPPTPAVSYTLETASEVGGPLFALDQTYVRATSLGSQISTLTTVAATLSPSGLAGGPEFKPDQTYVRATQLGSQISVLTGAAAKPFAQIDWPNPRGIRNPQDWQYRTPPQILQAPFSQKDWPNPRGQSRNPDWSDSFKLPLTTVRAPYTQYDWPVPKGAKSVPGFEVSGLALQSAVVVYPATIVFDWPNPRGPVFPISLRTWTDSFKLPLTTVVGFNQRDWPNPRGAKGVDGFTQSGLTLALQPTKPFNQTDWPVPVGKVSFDLRGWTDSFKLPLTTVRPPSIQRDWPVPKGARPIVQDWRWFNLPTATFVQPKPPPSQLDWPNPRGYPPLKLSISFPASQNFWPPTIPPIPPVIVLPRAKFIKTTVSGPLGRSQVTGPGGKVQLASGKGQTQVTGGKGKTQVRGPKGRTDASDP